MCFVRLVSQVIFMQDTNVVHVLQRETAHQVVVDRLFDFGKDVEVWSTCIPRSQCPLLLEQR
jgi:hypothetical protein